MKKEENGVGKLTQKIIDAREEFKQLTDEVKKYNASLDELQNFILEAQKKREERYVTLIGEQGEVKAEYCSSSTLASPQFKDGDFVFHKWDYGEYNACNVAILKYLDNQLLHYYFRNCIKYNKCEVSSVIEDNSIYRGHETELRLATPEEKQILIDFMHEQGKDWDAKNKKIVDYKWIPKYGEEYYTISFTSENCILRTSNYNLYSDRAAIKNGCWKTEAEALKAFEKLKK